MQSSAQCMVTVIIFIVDTKLETLVFAALIKAFCLSLQQTSKKHIVRKVSVAFRFSPLARTYPNCPLFCIL